MKHLKQEFDKLTFKDTLIYLLAILSQLTAFVLLFCGMFIPPEGEIHDSVLTAFGLVLLFVGSLLGINMRYDHLTASFKSTIIETLAKSKREEDITEDSINLTKDIDNGTDRKNHTPHIIMGMRHNNREGRDP